MCAAFKLHPMFSAKCSKCCIIYKGLLRRTSYTLFYGNLVPFSQVVAAFDSPTENRVDPNHSVINTKNILLINLKKIQKINF